MPDSTPADLFSHIQSSAALADLQFAKLQQGLGRVLETNAFYQSKFREAGLSSSADLTSLEDLSRLPFTTKEELLLDQTQSPPYGTNLTLPLECYTRVHQTSGTTGEPLRWLDTQESWQWMAACWETVLRASGVTASDRIFFAFSFGPFIGFWCAHEAANRMGALCIPGGGMSTRQRLHALLASEATVLLSTPTYALHLAEVAYEEGINIRDSAVRITIHGGEPGAGIPSTRKRIEEAWGAVCYDHAGSTEVGPWGFEGPEQVGLYVDEAEFIAEIVDPVTDEPASEGELVITNLGRLGMPVYRYRTRDRVVLSNDAPDNGIPFRLLKDGVIGRIDDAVTIRGVTVYPSMFENIVRRYSEIEEFAVDVRSKDELDEIELRVEVSREPAGVADTVARDIRNAIGMRITVVPVEPGSLPRYELKAKRFHDHRS